MFNAISRWQRKRLLGRLEQASRARWLKQLNALPILDGLTAQDQQRLIELGWLFLHQKRFTPVMNAGLTSEHCIDIALMAALPVLKLDLAAYGPFHELLIYPEEFVSPRHYVDDNGVEHRGLEELSGEAWEQGPVLLSLSELAYSGDWNGFNLVIHELAHKLDMANGGVANGYPDIPVGLRQRWLEVFPRDFEQHVSSVEQAEQRYQRAPQGSAEALNAWNRVWIDPYAAESEAEFFAVTLETFFSDPVALHHAYPEIYRLFNRWLVQDPISRAPGWCPLIRDKLS